MTDVPFLTEAPVLQYFPKELRWTRRSRVELDRSVLLYEASYPTIADGLSRVQDDGFAAVVERRSYPMEGWAQAVGAVNLDTGANEEPLPTDVADAAHTIADLAYNGLGADPAKRVLPGILGELHAAGSLTWALPSAVLAHAPRTGHSMETLTKLLERLIGRPPPR